VTLQWHGWHVAGLHLAEFAVAIEQFSLYLMQPLCLQEDAQLEMSAAAAAEQLLAEEEMQQAKAAAKKAKQQRQQAKKVAAAPLVTAAEADRPPTGSSAPAVSSETDDSPAAAPEADGSAEMMFASASASEPAESAAAVSNSSPRHTGKISKLAASQSSVRSTQEVQSLDQLVGNTAQKHIVPCLIRHVCESEAKTLGASPNTASAAAVDVASQADPAVQVAIKPQSEYSAEASVLTLAAGAEHGDVPAAWSCQDSVSACGQAGMLQSDAMAAAETGPASVQSAVSHKQLLHSLLLCPLSQASLCDMSLARASSQLWPTVHDCSSINVLKIQQQYSCM